MQLVAGIRHRDRADDLASRTCDFGSTSTTAMRIRHLAVGIEGRDIGERLRRRLHRHARRRIEGRIGCPGRHGAFSSLLPILSVPIFHFPCWHASSMRSLALAHDGSEGLGPVFPPFERCAAPLRRALAEAGKRALVDALVDRLLVSRHDAGAPRPEQRAPQAARCPRGSA